MTVTARMRRLRARQASGKIVVQVEVDEVHATRILEDARLLPPQRDHTREDIAHAIARLLDLFDERDA